MKELNDTSPIDEPQRCRPIPLVDRARVEAEYSMVEALFPDLEKPIYARAPIPPEIRGPRNAQIRQLLPTFSNETLLALAGSHELSWQELISRLRGHSPFAPESLGRLLSWGGDTPGIGPRNRALYAFTLQNMVEVIPQLEIDQTADAISLVFPPGRPCYPVIEYLLRSCADPKTVSEKLGLKKPHDPVLPVMVGKLDREIDPSIEAYVDFFLQYGRAKTHR